MHGHAIFGFRPLFAPISEVGGAVEPISKLGLHFVIRNNVFKCENYPSRETRENLWKPIFEFWPLYLKWEGPQTPKSNLGCILSTVKKSLHGLPHVEVHTRQQALNGPNKNITNVYYPKVEPNVRISYIQLEI